MEPPVPFGETDLIGEWATEPGGASVALGPTPDVSHVRRLYSFTPTHYAVRYHFFGDQELERPLVSFRLSGAYRLGSPLPEMPTARSVLVVFERVLLTVEDTGLLPAVSGSGDSTWEVGVQQDVTRTGALTVRPHDECGRDLDIVELADGRLRFGFRTKDMCAQQPTRLQDKGVVRATATRPSSR